ncbi:hypothetical protein DRH29_04845 [candidate division Kazan bacterium]|uniref:Uncharacterized protein n=1 Tax=candidate division Kazan bacterium TaxID=2202143 RepID=A0A420ZBJ9_UNCK3|nr:MAG: hypothetical protein DRH29_04845 [candidate division Kazan bacterium]
MRYFDRKLIKELLEQNLSDREIAAKLGCCKETVARVRRSLGIPRKKLRQSKVSDETLLEYWKQGYSINAIAMKLGMSLSYISERMHRLSKKFNLRLHYTAAGKEWRKLKPANQKYISTKLVSLPGFYIERVGFDPKRDLMGKWEINKDGELVLKLKYADDQ